MKLKLAITALALFSVTARSTRADAVLDWNAIASPIIVTAPTRPAAAGILDFAVLHAAIHDTVQSYQRRFQPYAISLHGVGSMEAAIAKASHDVLVNRFPSQAATLDTSYNEYLAARSLSSADPGVGVGQAVAAAVIALRATDNSFPVPPPAAIVGGPGPGVWRPGTSYIAGPPPASGAAFAVPWVADVTPFAMLNTTQFRPGPPPALTSAQYAYEYNEVKALGRDTSTVRTPQQTQLAVFWSDNFIALWNRGLRSIAQSRLSDSGDIARLFALAWMSSADAAISVWDAKRFYLFWRPVAAIQEGETDGNRHTIGDPNWKPFINTPNYPDYTSGANGLTGAITRTLKLFFGNDHMIFTLTSNSAYGPIYGITPQPRSFYGFTAASDEVVEARILQGIHFRTADLVGREQGRAAAEWAFAHILRPL